MRRAKGQGNFDVDVSSFSDIAFLLIIFFILTTSLSRPTGRIVDVPSASRPETQKKNSDDKIPSVNILPDRVLLGDGEEEGREITLVELRSNLLARNLPKEPENKRMVVVEVGEEVEYERYYRIVSMIAEAGGIVAMVED